MLPSSRSKKRLEMLYTTGKIKNPTQNNKTGASSAISHLMRDADLFGVFI